MKTVPVAYNPHLDIYVTYVDCRVRINMTKRAEGWPHRFLLSHLNIGGNFKEKTTPHLAKTIHVRRVVPDMVSGFRVGGVLRLLIGMNDLDSFVVGMDIP